MKQGRPTSFDQNVIQEILFQYYENNVEATTASKKTRFNYKTVLKYYRMWDKELLQTEKNDFLMRIKITKERNILMLDNELVSLFSEKQIIQRLMDNILQTGNTSEYEKLSRLKIKITEQILDIMSAKINLIGAATADVIINQKESQNV
jgi:hypothetical protein